MHWDKYLLRLGYIQIPSGVFSLNILHRMFQFQLRIYYLLFYLRFLQNQTRFVDRTQRYKPTCPIVSLLAYEFPIVGQKGLRLIVL